MGLGTDARETTLVLVVDDDAGMRAAVVRVLSIAGLEVMAWASGKAFLDQAPFERAGCILLDVAMPGMSGLEVQAALKQRRIMRPVVFLTGTADIPVAVTAMREGAHDFLEKPFDNTDLVARVRAAMAIDARARAADFELGLLRRRFESLTSREREVMEHVVAGLTSKQIARVVGASHRTVEIHRGRIMEKVGASSLAELVRMRLHLLGREHD